MTSAWTKGSILFLLTVATLWFCLSQTLKSKPVEKFVGKDGEREQSDLSALRHQSSTFFSQHFRLLSSKKPVNILVGVLQEMHENDEDAFWILFDPGLDFALDRKGCRLPYVIVPRRNGSHHQFFFHQLAGCSSIYPGSLAQPDDVGTREQRIALVHERCEQEFKKPLSLNDVVLRWDRQVKFRDVVHSDSCFRCASRAEQQTPLRLPCITLDEVFESLALSAVDFLKIDAQGADFEIISSLKPQHLRRVHRIEVECQDDFFLYISEMPNRCSDIVEYLTARGFEVEKRISNNCGCLENNLFFSQSASAGQHKH